MFPEGVTVPAVNDVLFATSAWLLESRRRVLGLLKAIFARFADPPPVKDGLNVSEPFAIFQAMYSNAAVFGSCCRLMVVHPPSAVNAPEIDEARAKIASPLVNPEIAPAELPVLTKLAELLPRREIAMA